jgi:hypothetical protein
VPSAIRYHAHCLDGIVSAALALRLHGRAIHRIEPYHHVPAGQRPSVSDDAVGVDIPLLPGMVEWYDHHASGFQFLALVANADLQRVRRIAFDASAHSCAQLLPYPPHFVPLIHDVAQHDGGQFADAHAACDLSNPVLLAARTINRVADSALEADVIQRLAHEERDPIAALVAMIPPDAAAATVAAAQTHGEYLRSAGHLIGPILAADLTEFRGAVEGISTYQPFQLFPNAVCCVLLIATSHRTFVFLGVNPWRQKITQAFRLDLIANRFGGGGHPRASGVTFPPTNAGRSRAKRAFRAILQHLLPQLGAD